MTMPSPPALSDADFDAICAAVMETNRGRWFLAEYARRNRHADTQTLLAAIERLESVMRRDAPETPSLDRVRFGLADMADAIARTKQEIAALRPDAEHGAIDDATGELDAIVSTTEKATSDILAAAEQIQETAWALREQGASPQACDQLDGHATDVYTACSFQDLTGQRTRKVINVLRYLEARIDTMIGIWGDAAPAAERPAWRGADALLNGPAKPGQGLDQADVDLVMGPSAAIEVAPAAQEIIVPADIEAAVAGGDAALSNEMEIADAEEAFDPVIEAMPACSDDASPHLAFVPASRLAELSYAERIALFT